MESVPAVKATVDPAVRAEIADPAVKGATVARVARVETADPADRVATDDLTAPAHCRKPISSDMKIPAAGLIAAAGICLLKEAALRVSFRHLPSMLPSLCQNRTPSVSTKL